MALGIISFIQSCSRLLRLARKPGRAELWRSIKVCAAGITLVGVVGFIIKLLSVLIGGAFSR